MTETLLTPRTEQVLALALERQRAKLIAGLHALGEDPLGEAGTRFAAGGPPAAIADPTPPDGGLTLARVERTRLALVDAALGKLAEGQYGACEECGRPILLPRLQALPWAQRCRRCVEQPRPAPDGSAPTAPAAYTDR
jgi:hypothetical protein